METDAKFELLIRRMDEAEASRLESEVKRLEAETKRIETKKKNQEDLLSVKAAVESWILEVERKIEGLQGAVGRLQLKVERLEYGKEQEEDRGAMPAGSLWSLTSGGAGSEAVRRFREEVARSEDNAKC
ncbi:hypothetical protein GUJ93_ZPchr0015g6930 [Zizania palustris]|uniref:Uncharacterized protein n=1 Tax=Zizania palustris TaxID=103762 RepID=A0A8J5TI18_ZIZPA|nr:hypothetical protein GUJ93_ZPchr0015g6930 [Zizania palustris]